MLNAWWPAFVAPDVQVGEFEGYLAAGWMFESVECLLKHVEHSEPVEWSVLMIRKSCPSSVPRSIHTLVLFWTVTNLNANCFTFIHNKNYL